MSKPIIHEVPAPYVIAAVLQSDAILSQLQHELYRALPGITMDRLREILRQELLRSEYIEGRQAHEADTLMKRLGRLRQRGLTTTEALKIVTGQEKTDDAEEDVYRILLDDKRYAADGG